jgi:hypothetical protein
MTTAQKQFRIGKPLRPLDEIMPFIQLVTAPVFADIGKHFIIQHDRPGLIVAGRKKLNHLPPRIFVFVTACVEQITIQVQNVNDMFKGNFSRPGKVFVGKIIKGEFLVMDFVHRGTGIRHGSHLVGVKLFPPIQRGGYVHPHDNHTPELPMNRASARKPKGKVFVIGAKF